MALTDLPASLQLNIMQCLADGRDLVSLGQVCPELGTLTEDRLLWKKLCQYHFTDRQVGRNQAQYRLFKMYQIMSQQSFSAALTVFVTKNFVKVVYQG